MATEPQVRKIHALKSNLHLGDSDYRVMLSAYRDEAGRRAASSRDLSVEQASSLIDSLERIVDRTPGIRDRVYASPKQLRFINALWNRVSKARDAQGRRRTLDSFLRRRFHVRRSDHLPRKVAPKVIKSLRMMDARREQGEGEKETGKEA
ncbi:MAG: DUF1018 domain-containing protein [Chitinivibrionales bacterium]|nr:DUF1018 domain-containing protein [Chitinivibrionales bacterium]MBD3395299.1 DUF1018 domain-containing protein [Chitinivibrionales bacterium]